MRPRKLLRMAVAVATTLLLPSAHAFCPSGMAIRTRSSSQQLLWQVPSRAERQRQGTVTTATTARTHRQQLALFNSNNNDDNEVESAVLPVLTHDTPPQVYPQRWIQLSYLSALALISDWICFSVAATPGVYEQNFGHSAATIIDIFLFTNVATCFLVTDIVNKFGLQKAVQSAAVVMAIGCWFRSGLSFLPVIPGTEHLVSYASVVGGTILVGAAQPFFQCTPPVLSAIWFAPQERATSTAIALNFNQIGIATAFLVGGSMAKDGSSLEVYFGLIAVLATLTAFGTLLQFENEPLIPPSTSEIDKRVKGEIEPPFLESAAGFFQMPGFSNALAAFVCSITITNIVGAFIGQVMSRGGITDQLSVDLAGAGFEAAILIGGIILGGYVDRTKQYKKVTLACLAMTAFMCIPLGLTDHALGKEPILLVAALLGLGISAGPVQPINAELAVDVTYPGDETAVESVQQIGGNLVTALLVPVADLLAKRDFTLFGGVPLLESDIRGDCLMLFGLAMLTIAYFSSFDAPLLRSMADAGEGEEDMAKTPFAGSIDVESVVAEVVVEP